MIFFVLLSMKFIINCEPLVIAEAKVNLSVFLVNGIKEHLVLIIRVSISPTLQMNLATDEEVLLFDSPIGSRTWAFLIREKRLIASIFVHSIVCGIVCGSAVYYIRPRTILEFNVVSGRHNMFLFLHHTYVKSKCKDFVL